LKKIPWSRGGAVISILPSSRNSRATARASVSPASTPAANLFAGNENDRSHVQQFIALLTRIAVQGHTAVVLVSHPSLTGINTGSGLSGSTAWHNSVRSRLYLKKAATEKGEEPDPNLRVLEVMKSNYGPPAEALTLRWKDGLFLPVAAPGSLERMAREQKVDDLFLKLLDRSAEQGRNLSDKKTAHTYAPSRFVSEPEAKAVPGRQNLQRAIRTTLKRVDQIGEKMTGPHTGPHADLRWTSSVYHLPPIPPMRWSGWSTSWGHEVL